MAVPRPSFGPNGFVTPPEPDILLAVKQEINQAFGGDLNMADETPQGQIAVSETASIGNANDSFVFLAQQSDPAYASGRYQDGIGRIYYITRFPARPTVVTVTCLGQSGVIIPVNALVQADDNTQYIAVDGGTIPNSGTIDLQFAAVIPGPVPCPAGSINTIYQSVNGWDGVSNAADGILGRNTETRSEFEQRRTLSVAHNSQGALASVLGAVLTVDDVLDAFVAENNNNTSQTIRGFTLAANSIYVAAVGGTNQDVAEAIFTKKSPGCGYNGNTSVIVLDQNEKYNPPYPAYIVKFERPSAETVIFTVTLANNIGIPANATELIQNAIVQAFAGADGGPRARIGDTVYASRFYAPISNLGGWAQIVTIKVGCSSLPAAAFTASIAGPTMTVSSIDTGIIGIGQSVVGDGIVPGSVIIGGSGLVWTLSTVQTVSSQIMYSVVANADDVTLDIDQQPVTAPGNTTVLTI